MLTIHLRINDAATGAPTPVRVRVSAPDGSHFAPHGSSVEFPVGRNEAVGEGVRGDRERWYVIEGACEIALPASVPLRVQATKGPEYTPLDQTVTLGAGQMALRFALERESNMRAGGWVSIDSRCHFLAPHAALLEAAAEDLDVVNLLATPQRFPSQDGTAYLTVPNLAAFSGQTPVLTRGHHAVVVNTLNTHPVLGKVSLLNSHRPVFPLSFGGDDTDDWGISDWCGQCHRKGGLAVWVGAFESLGGLIGGEALVAAVLGQIDALEVTGEARKTPLLPWLYRLWNAGFPVPLIGGSGKDSNRTVLGSTRTYTRPESGATWVEAVRTGRAFVTTGPLLELARGGTRFTATVRAGRHATGVELVANGKVIASGDGPAGAVGEFAGPGWVAARCAGATGFAHTSPVTVGEVVRDPSAVGALAKLVEQTREWGEQHGRYANPKRREQFLARCAEALTKLGPPR